MQQDLRTQFLDDDSSQLKQLYQDLKQKRKIDEQRKHHTEGFMFTGTRLDLTDKDELDALMETVHLEVFGMSIAEPRLKTLKNEQDEADWSYYDTPITQRSHDEMAKD